MIHYILIGKDAAPCQNLLKWMNWFEQANRKVAFDQIEQLDSLDPIEISTVFLGMDHRFFESGPPILFETMVFGGALDQEQKHYCSWEDAEIGHALMLERVKEKLHS